MAPLMVYSINSIDVVFPAYPKRDLPWVVNQVGFLHFAKTLENLNQGSLLDRPTLEAAWLTLLRARHNKWKGTQSLENSKRVLNNGIFHSDKVDKYWSERKLKANAAGVALNIESDITKGHFMSDENFLKAGKDKLEGESGGLNEQSALKILKGKSSMSYSLEEKIALISGAMEFMAGLGNPASLEAEQAELFRQSRQALHSDQQNPDVKMEEDAGAMEVDAGGITANPQPSSFPGYNHGLAIRHVDEDNYDDEEDEDEDTAMEM